MATIKENKGKEVVDEVVRQGKTQPRPSVGEKSKSISKGVDLGNFPSRRKEKRLSTSCPKLRGLGPLLLCFPSMMPPSRFWTLI